MYIFLLPSSHSPFPWQSGQAKSTIIPGGSPSTQLASSRSSCCVQRLVNVATAAAAQSKFPVNCYMEENRKVCAWLFNIQSLTMILTAISVMQPSISAVISTSNSTPHASPAALPVMEVRQCARACSSVVPSGRGQIISNS